ncbi:citrate lyase holo-[acyl-carrier protein] synthase [Paratissierella segnis]|jgi:holo-ACP synthase|uniref:citrate lyase holo-[acyl-carrier protein] synthase n=1 Tax=Paratissierella segnis TaxID=2763679 RepID=A0A926ER18_9FIRM|nr:citrate lyase holo-[acyl-carrier protein] synthase [Paratissierella segnis]MBC8587246.1 citrate lyase holo-[acyl-carrier protein] synthase [Paratissierella segnis]
MINEKILLEILKSREDRANRQEELLKKYPYSLISFTLNTPGEIKDSILYRKVHKEGIEAIRSTLGKHGVNMVFSEELHKNTGPEFYAIVDIDANSLKGLMVDIEDNHRLGRIFDIDVFDKGHNQIGRSKLGLSSRKCLICNEDARNCMINRTHSYEDLIKKVEEIVSTIED